MQITLELRKSYGHDRLYPDCEKSKLLAELIGRKCFEDEQIEIFKKLGWEIIIVSGVQL